jgi:hypothetical protein
VLDLTMACFGEKRGRPPMFPAKNEFSVIALTASSALEAGSGACNKSVAEQN